MEADLALLRRQITPGALAATFAIVPSIAAGAVFAYFILDRSLARGVFLGVVLSVTAVSVAAKLLMERGIIRRTYAQVILAAGVAGEVLVWIVIPAVADLQGGHAFKAFGRSALLAAIFFLTMMIVGRRFTQWTMRRVADFTKITGAQLSLAIIFVLASAAATEALGLHALLGAFVFGVLLGQSPRVTAAFRENLHTLTVCLFAPIFFALAGMRVDANAVASPIGLRNVLLLFAVASFVKIGLGGMGAKLGGLRWAESLAVGIGLNLKGGTDVIVAILGVQLGLLSESTYTLYTVVAILTVLACPPALSWLERYLTPTDEEAMRLRHDEAKRRAYFSEIEKVLVPVGPDLFTPAVAELVHALARTKQSQTEFFDITELNLPQRAGLPLAQESGLTPAGALEQVELTKTAGTHADPTDAILAEAASHGLIAFAAKRPLPDTRFTLGLTQDRVIDAANKDVLAILAPDHLPPIRRILTPVGGAEYTLAAADIAAHLAAAYHAELVLMTIVRNRNDAAAPAGEYPHDGHRLLEEVRFRVERLHVRPTELVLATDADPAAEILRACAMEHYDLIVIGSIDKNAGPGVQLGHTAQTLITGGNVPMVLLVAHDRPA